MSLLNITPIAICSRLWTVNPEKKTMVVEHSELGSPELYNRLYDDACDVGIALYNQPTGNTVRWYMADEVWNDNDLEQWIFKPVIEDVRKNPNIYGWEVIIIND